jgi:hypothetical protein
VTKHSASGAHLRQIPSIASKLVEWLRIFCDSGSLQEFICLIIEYLLVSEDYMLGQEVGAAGGIPVLSELFKASAETTKNAETASRVLVGVLVVVDKKYLVDCNSIVKTDVVSVMSCHLMNLQLQLAGLNILHCLFYRSSSADGQCNTFVPVITKCMENHFGNIDLLTLCCTILRMVAVRLDDWTVIIGTGAARTIVNAMLVHPTSIELVLEGMATIKDLATKESFRTNFYPEDAELAVVSLLPLHIHNPEVVSLAFATLNNIAVNSSKHKVAPMQPDVLHFILSALSEFSDDYHVTKNACLLLKSYTYDINNLEMIRSYSTPIVARLSPLSESSNTNIRERSRYILRKM